MTARPAFMFFPKDWRNDQALRRCSDAARGAWMDILCTLHDSEEYGVARYPLRELVKAAGVRMALAQELISKSVLKGADSLTESFVWSPRHAGKKGEPVELVTADGGPCWYCKRFVVDEHVRSTRGAGTRFGADNQPPKDSPIRRVGDGEGTRQGEQDQPPTGPVGDESGERQGDGLSFAVAFALKEPSVGGIEARPQFEEGANPGDSTPAPFAITPIIAACQSMIAAGCPSGLVKHSNTNLQEGIRDGITPPEWATAVRNVLALENPPFDVFAYACRVARTTKAASLKSATSGNAGVAENWATRPANPTEDAFAHAVQ